MLKFGEDKVGLSEFTVNQAFTRHDATDPAASAWVAANAGSGKTHLLVSRVLRLLLSGVAPSRILCLTYTRAAAAEMSERIYGRLADWAVMERGALVKELVDLLGEKPAEAIVERAARLFAALVDAPAGLRLGTIHSFCQSVLRRFPLEAGVASFFRVMDERSASELLHEATLRLYAQSVEAEDTTLGEAFAALAGRMSESGLHKLLREVTQQRRKWQTFIGDAESIFALYGIAADTSEEAIIAECAAYSENELAQLRAAVALLDKTENETNRMTVEALAPWLSQEERTELVEAYLRGFLTKEATPRKKLSTKDVLPPELEEALAAERERAVLLAGRLNVLRSARLSAHMFTVSRVLFALYDDMKRQRALMDYDDLVMAVSRLLSQPDINAWVMFKLDGGIDHVLVDEAQDTSEEQWRIVQALTQEYFAGEGRSDEERTLFVVGDEKQSIFRFQGAAPEAFAAYRDIFGHKLSEAGKQLIPLPLPESFRSVEPVLQVVDAIFTEASHTLKRKKEAGLVELWPLVAKNEKETKNWQPMRERKLRLSAEHRLAEAIAETVAEWLAHGEVLTSKGRAMQPGDIMVLVRRRNSFVDMLIRQLKRRGVAVAGIDRMELAENLAVKDLMALGHFLLLPEDDLNLASLLKSPLCNVSEEGLFALAHGRGEKTLWQRVQGAGGAAMEFLSGLLARTDYARPYELFAHALGALGGRARMVGRMGEEYNDPIDEFLTQALAFEEMQTPSLQAFLHWMISGETMVKRDLDKGGGEVRVMTVHGAKGLEAPVVILPDTTTLPEIKPSLFWQKTTLGLAPLMVPVTAEDTALTASLRAENKAREMEEYRRLLYVAMTRAEDRLYICGAEPGKGNGAESWYNTVLAALKPIAEEVETPLGPGLRMESPQVAAVKGEAAEATRVVSPVPDYLSKAAAQEVVPRMQAAPREGVASPLRESIVRRGTLMHTLLQYLPTMEPSRRAAVAQAWLANTAPEMGEETRLAMAEEVVRLIHAPEFAPFFAEGSIAEAPVVGRVAGVAVSRQIDRLAITPEAIWILDYKTHTEPPGSLQAVPAAYIRQLATYRALMQQAYPGRAVHCALLWTAGPSLMSIPETLMDSAFGP